MKDNSREPDARTYIENLDKFGSRLGLRRIKRLLDYLDHPEESCPAIHVGGTNGKGSTTAMLASIYSSAGYRVGRYISPAVTGFSERLWISGEEIPEDRLNRLLRGALPAINRVARELEHPTSFEVTTALAFLHFASEGVDLAVVEVGMGGRLDATNTARSLISVITSISRDHTEVLGSSLPEITNEVGGIVREGGRLITATCDPRVNEILRAICRKKRAEFHTMDGTGVKPGPLRLSGQEFDLVADGNHYPGLINPLLGRHQLDNAALSVRTTELLRDSFPITPGNVKRGLADLVWPGRMEVVRTEPLVMLDGAHNADAAEKLASSLDALRGGRDTDYRRLILVLSISDDKDATAILSTLLPRAHRTYISRNNTRRAFDPHRLADMAPEEERGKIEVIPGMNEAIISALEETGKGDLLLVTGSLHTVAQARRFLKPGDAPGERRSLL